MPNSGTALLSKGGGPRRVRRGGGFLSFAERRRTQFAPDTGSVTRIIGNSFFRTNRKGYSQIIQQGRAARDFNEESPFRKGGSVDRTFGR